MERNEPPRWMQDKHFNEVLFCEDFLSAHPMACVGGSFFTVEGRVADEESIRKQIYEMLRPHFTSGTARRATSLLETLKLEAYTPELPIQEDRIHVANGTLFLSGAFQAEKEFCRNRLPVNYDPTAPQPVTWLRFLSDLLEPEDILTLQEYLGYAILRFAKYKRPEIGHIESHNERTKEKYSSNPDVDMSRSHLNFHLVTPQRKYRAEVEKQIAEAGCRTRSDSVRVVEALVTASPEFFKGKKKSEVKLYFQEALGFIQEHQDPRTIISAVVQMDEKTPHMHLCFVPLTEDGRLSAKEIVGNKKKLTQWQDRFWEHMVKKYPDLERGESASETGRDHIPPRLFKEAVHLNRMKEQIMAILNDTNPFNKKAKLDELEALLGKYVPGAEALRTKLRKYDAAYKALTAENAALEKQLGAASKESVLKKLEINEKLRELDELHRMVDGIPPEILQAAKQVATYKPQER